MYGFDFDPTSHESCRAAAQKHANETGADFGITRDLFRSWMYMRLPPKSMRFGLDLTCEVVHPCLAKDTTTKTPL